MRQSEQPEPMCAASVLAFHDAAELFLVLACEHLDVGKKNMAFMTFWEELNRKLPDDGLTQKKAMSRLNEARVGVKHHGNMPARSTIQEYYYIVTLFFQENTPTVFDIEFDNISMVNLIRDSSIRADLEKAEKLREQGDLKTAIDRVAIAFYRLLERHKERNSLLSGLNWPTFFPRPSTYGYGRSRGRSGPGDDSRKVIGDILKQTESLKKAVEPMQDAMVALALGLDYGRYEAFLDLTPPVAMMLPEGEESSFGSRSVPTSMYDSKRPRYINPTSYRFCFDFVIEAVTHSQSDAGSLNLARTLRLGQRP